MHILKPYHKTFFQLCPVTQQYIREEGLFSREVMMICHLHMLVGHYVIFLCYYLIYFVSTELRITVPQECSSNYGWQSQYLTFYSAHDTSCPKMLQGRDRICPDIPGMAAFQKGCLLSKLWNLALFSFNSHLNIPLVACIWNLFLGVN